MNDEERKFYEKYIRPQYRIIQRIKFKIFPPRKRIKTIKDFDGLEGGFLYLVKIILGVMIVSVALTAIAGVLAIYRWFFPAKEYIVQSPFFRYIYMSNWILIANTTPPMADYSRLVFIMVVLFVVIAGLRGIIRGSRKKEDESDV